MNLTINGEWRTFTASMTVAELVHRLGARERGSAVAVDGVVVPRGEWDEQLLTDGQTVELVHAVQGG
jgi:sulfur carrier protein